MRAIAGSVSIEWAGEELTLLPERAVWWRRRRMLIVADMHLGKAAAFRAAGVPVPEVVEADLARLGGLIEASGAERVVVVGDLLHARTGQTRTVTEAVRVWRSRHAGMAMTLVLGNHDQRSGDVPPAWKMDVHAPPYAIEDDELVFVHDPETEAVPGRMCVAGHLHPSIVIGDGSSSLRGPCFWVREQTLVLPAFGRFTGTRSISPVAGDRVFVIGAGEVAEVRARTGVRAAAR